MSSWMAREERQARILALLAQRGRVRMADLREAMPENGAESLRLDCSALVEAGLLEAVGNGRGRVYVATQEPKRERHG
jgi:DeoR/GlpR family transcriptional regulator of sugar metabolism